MISIKSNAAVLYRWILKELLQITQRHLFSLVKNIQSYDSLHLQC